MLFVFRRFGSTGVFGVGLFIGSFDCFLLLCLFVCCSIYTYRILDIILVRNRNSLSLVILCWVINLFWCIARLCDQLSILSCSMCSLS